MNVQLKPDQYLIDSHGNPKAVILSFSHYQKLIRLIEDLDDTTHLKKAIQTSTGFIPHADLLKRLKREKLI